MQIIVTGHGHFATGLASTVTLLAGQLNQVTYQDFTADMSEQDLGTAFKALLDQDSAAVFFCDLIGGTPFKQAAWLKTDYPNTAVLAGGNIASLLEVGLQNDWQDTTDASALAKRLILASQSGLKQFGQPSAQTALVDDDSDGI